MKKTKHIFTITFFASFWVFFIAKSTEKTQNIIIEKKQDTILNVLVGATQMQEYLPKLQGKNVALVVNNTALFPNGTHLVDTLLALKVNVRKVFAPEHGFRGNIDAGETVQNMQDKKTLLPIISLYGTNKKPTAEQLQDVEIIIFDIQDVGVRFYTYISTLHYVMEACAENNKILIVLDRPNPNASYIDGCVLQKGFESFVGMHPVPIVYGLTIGEYALMINGEKWLKNQIITNLMVIKNKNYTHQTIYSLPVKPSPNLPNDLAIALYPSLCLFEGTNISVGRGTTYPFQVIGFPDVNMGQFSFTPVSIDGMAKQPMYQNQICYGIDLRQTSPKYQFTLQYIIDFYHKTTTKDTFFNQYFNTLVGNSVLQWQIKQGLSEEEIRKTWQEDIKKYKITREKYLLYP
ncbi:MAG: DUF1343 domain-containing protein [Cytophagales bacterium]|nr:MAG: DUF1343 domain-containing protein [Cytophagales bacterium]